MAEGPVLFERYLAALCVAARRPSVDALAELTSAHLAHVPFENVSKLYYRRDASRRGVSNLGRFLDGIERFHLGGTCYTSAFHFHELLAHLGYDVALCGADMSTPNVHIVNVVTLEGRRHLVDIGYAAPLVEPVPLDGAADREFAWRDFRYLVMPRGPDGRPTLEMYRGGERYHGYRVNLAPRRIEEFAGVIADSFAADATFMNALLVARFGPRRSATLRHLTLTVRDGSSWIVEDVARARLPEAIEREFGMPLEIARQALDGVELSGEP